MYNKNELYNTNMAVSEDQDLDTRIIMKKELEKVQLIYQMKMKILKYHLHLFQHQKKKLILMLKQKLFF